MVRLSWATGYVSVDAYPDDVFNGKVTQVRLNPTEESNVITYEVVVSADNADHKLIPGLTANITIYTAESQNALIVPASALKFSPKDIDDESLPQKAQDAPADAKAVVWTVRGGKLYPVAVTTGTNNGVNVEIVSGSRRATWWLSTTQPTWRRSKPAAARKAVRSRPNTQDRKRRRDKNERDNPSRRHPP